MPDPKVVLGVYLLDLIIIRLRLGGDHVDRDGPKQRAYANIGIERRGVGGVVVPCQRIRVHVRLVRRGAVAQSSVVLPAVRVEDLQRCFSSLAVVQTLLVFETIPPLFQYAGYLRGDPRV